MRNYKRKSDRASVPPDTMHSAALLVIDEGMSNRQVAKDHNICHVTLMRYCRKLRSLDGRNEKPSIGYSKPRQVLSEQIESELVKYLKMAGKMYYGLNPVEIRELAFQLGKANNANMPQTWEENRKAGRDWLSTFLKRHGDEISIRVPEATSLGRATSFNRHNVEKFFNNLESVLKKHSFDASSIYNMDETGVTTVQAPKKVVVEKGTKQVGKITSAERGALVTVACAVSASGNRIPPMFIFPRQKYRTIEHCIRDGPEDCIGACHQSGWMTENNFLVFMKHFVKHTRCSQDHPVLLILDNHVSHLSIEILDCAKENGVVMLSFPPHTSHKLQPLDRTVYGPFKSYINAGIDRWMVHHPGKPMSIYDIPGIVRYAFPLAMTPGNIVSGFRVTGIYPFDRNIFRDDEFLPSNVTDRPLPTMVSNILDRHYKIL